MRVFHPWNAFMSLEQRDYSWWEARCSYYVGKFNSLCLSRFCSTVCHLPYSGESNNSSLYLRNVTRICPALQFITVDKRSVSMAGVMGLLDFDNSLWMALPKDETCVLFLRPRFVFCAGIIVPSLRDWMNCCNSRILSSASWTAIRFCSSFIFASLPSAQLVYELINAIFATLAHKVNKNRYGGAVIQYAVVSQWVTAFFILHHFITYCGVARYEIRTLPEFAYSDQLLPKISNAINVTRRSPHISREKRMVSCNLCQAGGRISTPPGRTPWRRITS